MHVDHGEQPLVFDDEIILPPAPPAAVPRIAALFDLDKRSVQRQPLMWKDPCEIDQLMKQIEHGPLLGTQSPRHFFSAAPRKTDEVLPRDDRLDDQDGMFFQKARDFRSNRREAAMLNLDKLPISHRIDPVPRHAL